jgi:tetratricopeptide (TPR) repeat protein
MGKARIALATMLKNEERIVERMYRSVLPYVSAYAVLDTGSTDRTIEITERVLAELPGTIVEEPFVDFSFSRNKLLLHARQVAADQDCSHLILLDGDHVLHVEEGALDGELDLDSYLIELRGSLAYYLPYLIRAERPFHFLSRTHEFLSCPDGFSQDKLPGVWLEHHGDGGNRHDKFERDLEFLEADIKEDPNDIRAVFYLANTYRDLGRSQEALELYRRRVELGGWDEEVYYTLVQIADITGDTDDYLRAYSFRPTRKEALHRLTRKLNQKSYHKAAFIFGGAGVAQPPSDDILFVDAEADDFAMEFEYAIAAWWVGEREEAGRIFRDLLTRDLPQHYRDSVVSNLAHC